MIRADAHTEIERPPQTVFDFVVEHFYDNYPRWSPEVRALEPLSGTRLRPGARGRQVRVDQGRRTDTTFEVTALDPGRRVRFEACDRPAFVIEYRFAPLPEDRCRLDFTFELTRVEFYMRPFQRLIQRAIAEGSQRAVDNIKVLVEAEC